jgi:catechol 2,3-dioxygenase-like lactoylglutathione lyase family enzyme
VFLVDDVAATAQYYRDVLGFDVDFLWGDEASYGRVARDDAVIDLVRSEPPGGRNSIAAAGVERGADALIIVSDVEDVYIELQEKGVNVVVPLAAREYGMLDCMIEDINGYRLTIGGVLDEDDGEDER